MEHMSSIVYSLQGESLEIAKNIHAAHQVSQEDLSQIEAQVEEFRDSLISKFEEKSGEVFRSLFTDMAKAICVPVEVLRKYHLDLTYLENHGLAFLKEGPITDNVVVLNVEEAILAEELFE
jgi:hypothetical protein